MKYKKIILGVALALACFSSLNANALTETKSEEDGNSDRSTQRLLDRRLRKSILYHQLYHFACSEDCPQGVCGRYEGRNRIRCERKIRCSDTDLPARPAHQQGVFGRRKTRCAAASYYHRKGCFLHRYAERETHRYRKQRPRNGLRHHETL